MKRGIWHQFGSQSQTVALECLKAGVGAGVVISPRDLSRDLAVGRSPEYIDCGAEILIDPQFHVPGFANPNLATYPFAPHRMPMAQLADLSSTGLDTFSKAIETINRDLRAAAIIAPAVIREAGRNDVNDLNARLFAAAKRAGDSLGLPTYATAVLGHSVFGSEETLAAALAPVSALSCDGFYFAAEFGEDRLPEDQEAVFRCLSAGLTLASTGKPVMHAFAGPMALLSFGFGATAAAIGQTKNLWRFDRTRYGPTPDQGGGPDIAPSPRFFSATLWGTIVYPDETSQLSEKLLGEVLTHTPFSTPIAAVPPQQFTKGDSHRHLVHCLGSTATKISEKGTPLERAAAAMDVLRDALTLHSKVVAEGLALRDGSSRYQGPWRGAIAKLVNDRASDYAYLDLLS